MQQTARVTRQDGAIEVWRTCRCCESEAVPSSASQRDGAVHNEQRMYSERVPLAGIQSIVDKSQLHTPTLNSNNLAHTQVKLLTNKALLKNK